MIYLFLLMMTACHSLDLPDGPAPTTFFEEVPENKSKIPEEEISPGDHDGGENPIPENNSEIPEEEISVGEETPILKPDGKVRFTEVVTDPQQDWNDSSGGNGILFDAVVGNGKIGSTDEWIEIKNQSSGPVNLVDWRIEMKDGTDESDLLKNGQLLFSDESNLENFQSNDFLVFGNPSGDMKNEIQLQLFNSENQLIDEIFVEDGNAGDFLEESVQLNDENIWIKGIATPLE